MTTAPTCPVCTENADVQRHAAHWLCFGCWTVFTASQSEWDRCREQREFHQKMRNQLERQDA